MSESAVEYVCKLRSNIDLEGDLDLAGMEIEAVFDAEVEPVADAADAADDLPALGTLRGFEALDAHTRDGDTEAFRVSGEPGALRTAVERLSFVQRIYAVSDGYRAADLDADPAVSVTEVDGRQVVQAIPHYALFELSDVVARRSSGAEETRANLDRTLDALLGRAREGASLAEEALTMKRTSGLLSHDVHYYKAKFFPRMARAIVTVYGDDPDRVVDPFVGSGTSLLESALLGAQSVGFDIDPLSARISNVKLRALGYDSAAMADEVERLSHAVRELTGAAGSTQSTIGRFGAGADGSLLDAGGVERVEFPDWLLANRKMTDERAEELGRSIGVLRHVVSHADDRFRDLFRVLMSDAISRTIKFRFLGTGVGRFSLSFAATPMAETFVTMLERYVKVAAVSEWARETLDVDYAPAEAVRADARDLPCASDAFDFLVTSPPYLPASSGRESYAKARAPSLVALGLFEPDEIADLAGDAVGSMDPESAQLAELTDRERDLVEWLLDDDLREIKAAPTARYFLDMRATFAEMRRALEPGGRAVLVSGKQSTFYESESREPLYVAEAAEMLADEAERAGFEVLDRHDVQLEKPNRTARPRSLDDYYETLLVLRNPDE